MLRQERWFVTALLCGVAAACLIAPAFAASKGKKGGQKPAKLSSAHYQDQVRGAQAGLADAANRGVAAQSRLGASQSRAETARSALDTAEAEAEFATDRLREIEARIIRSQDDDSKYADLLNDFNEAQRVHEELRAHLYDSPDYQAKYRAAAASKDRGTLLPKLRKEAESDPEYKKAAMRLTIMRQTYEQHRSELFQQDPEWVATTKAAMEARKRSAEAQEHYKSAMVSQGITSSNLSKAARDAAAAQMAVSKAQNAIKVIEAYNKKAEEARKRQSSSNRRRR